MKLLSMMYGTNDIDGRSYGIGEPDFIDVNRSKDRVTVDIDYLMQIENIAYTKTGQVSSLTSKIKDKDRELSELIEKANGIISQQNKEIGELKNRYNQLESKFEAYENKTEYTDMDKEALKLALLEKTIELGNLRNENKHLLNLTPKVEFTRKEAKETYNKCLNQTRNRLREGMPEKTLNAFYKIGYLEKKLSKLEIDNQILKEKLGQGVTHNERIKKGYGNATKTTITREVVESLIEEGLNKTEIAKKLNVTRQTIYNVLKR